MRDCEYWAEQSSHISDKTLRCVECGSPWGGYGTDGKYYCVDHLHLSEIIRS